MNQTYTRDITHALGSYVNPKLELSELWDLERIGITQENLSPSERETVSIDRSSLENSDKSYIVRLPFKDDSRPSVNYRNSKGQLNSLIQRVSHDENLGRQYDEIVNSYIEKGFIEEIPNEPIAGHYLPHHPVFKKSTTTPVHIVFNASNKPTDGTSLNDCLLTGPSLRANYMISCSHFVKEDSQSQQTYLKGFIESYSMSKTETISNFCGSILKQKNKEHFDFV